MKREPPLIGFIWKKEYKIFSLNEGHGPINFCIVRYPTGWFFYVFFFGWRWHTK